MLLFFGFLDFLIYNAGNFVVAWLSVNLRRDNIEPAA